MRVIGWTLLTTALLILVLSLSNPLQPPHWPDALVIIKSTSDLKLLISLSGVEDVIRVQQGQFSLQSDQKHGLKLVVRATMIGIEPTAIANHLPPIPLVQGQWYQASGQATIGSLLAHTLKLSVGDQLRLAGGILRISGVLSRSDTYLDSAIFLNPEDLPSQSYNYAYLFLREGFNPSVLPDDLNKIGLSLETDPFAQRGEEQKVLWTKVVVTLLVVVFLLRQIAEEILNQGKEQTVWDQLLRQFLAGVITGTAVALMLIHGINAALESVSFPLFRVTRLSLVIAYTVVLGGTAIGYFRVWAKRRIPNRSSREWGLT